MHDIRRVVNTLALPSIPHTESRGRILLVEDHIDTAFLIQVILVRNGYTTTVAHTLRDAILLAATEEFDLIISDLMLPDGTGWDLLESIKPLLGIKGIALSALSSRSDLQRSAAAGFDRHIIKPVRADILCETIAELLQEKSRAQELAGMGGNSGDTQL